jgi:hypothetical protein
MANTKRSVGKKMVRMKKKKKKASGAGAKSSRPRKAAAKRSAVRRVSAGKKRTGGGGKTTARKKPSVRAGSTSKRKVAKRAPARRPAAKRVAAKKSRAVSASGRKAPLRKSAVRAAGTIPAVDGRSKRAPSSGRTRPRATTSGDSRRSARGRGAEAAGQAGDTLGLSRQELAASESVEELVEEGQSFEASVVSGVENAPDADQGPIRTRQVPEDDVPEEYIDQEEPGRG